MTSILFLLVKLVDLLVAVDSHPFEGGVVCFVVKICHCVGVEDDALGFLGVELFAVEIKLPFNSRTCCLLSFAKVIEIAAEHSSVVWGEPFEYFELFGNEGNVLFLPSPHNDAVHWLEEGDKLVVALTLKTELAGVKHHPHINGANLVVVEAVAHLPEN